MCSGRLELLNGSDRMCAFQPVHTWRLKLALHNSSESSEPSRAITWQRQSLFIFTACTVTDRKSVSPPLWSASLFSLASPCQRSCCKRLLASSRTEMNTSVSRLTRWPGSSSGAACRSQLRSVVPEVFGRWAFPPPASRWTAVSNNQTLLTNKRWKYTNFLQWHFEVF